MNRLPLGFALFLLLALAPGCGGGSDRAAQRPDAGANRSAPDERRSDRTPPNEHVTTAPAQRETAAAASDAHPPATAAEAPVRPPVKPPAVSLEPKEGPELIAPSQVNTARVHPPRTAAAEHAAPSRVSAPRVAMQTNTAENASAAPEDAATPRGAENSSTAATRGFETVQVFYGTDRSADDISSSSWRDYLSHFYLTLGVFGATLLMALFARLRYVRGLSRSLAYAGAASTLTLGLMAALDCAKLHQQAQRPGAHYGNGRGELELGVCRVSIPATHQVGELEAPSVLRFEVREDENKHIVLQTATALSQETFFARLRGRVAGASRRDAFVFIHGFNVSFEDAARRTAQMAHDLRYDGAPVFYSWPSQAGLLKYTIDETNVEWTVPHLERFLQEVAAQSGAESISLIAHSMGNRAMTRALQRLAREPRDRPLFREVVLTAPDIDADVFKREIAPEIIRAARRVTLYASSNDAALKLSKEINGFPRAGDSGEDIIVLPGLDTIDVSAIDSSLVGHSYYGSNDTVLADLFYLLSDDRSPDQRAFLQPRSYQGLKYWAFTQQTAPAPHVARPGDGGVLR